MKILFQIEYHTVAGEQLCIVGNQPQLGSGDESKALTMTTTDGYTHRAEADISQAASELSYRYFVRHADGSVRREWGDDRKLRFDSHLASATLIDRWQDVPSDKPFYSQAFTDCIARRTPATIHSLKPGEVRISVEAPMLMPGQVLAICGSCDALGRWNPAEAPTMEYAGRTQWVITLPAELFRSESVEFKFIATDAACHTLLGWEKGENRHIDIDLNNSESAVISGLHFENPLPLWRGAGVAIPVFSLRTEKDFGVGDFFDLIELIEWAAETGQKMIQILPINDTTMSHTWMDSYPYNANSCFALHPMYLRLSEMGQLSDRHAQSRFDALQRELNTLPEVDYERVTRAKEEFTRLLFAQQGTKDLSNDEFKQFYATNKSWLKPYAAYCTLRDLNHTANTRDWGEFAVSSPSRIDDLSRLYADEFNYVYYIQFHLDRQLRHVHSVASSRGVALKGDIPIGISRDSVDAWLQPELFNLDMSAGAPPDDFAVLGQNWGFPTYNWEKMARDNYAWWRARFRKMAEYFDAYRIDHVLGFFRIWQIPLSALHGLLGYFNRALPLTPDEMLREFDFQFNKERMTQPYISDAMLAEIFGDLAEQVRSEYLTPSDNALYTLRPELSTQRAVAEMFASTDPTDEASLTICRGLLELLDQVLFVEDPYQPDHFHPRITAYTSYAYRALPDADRQRFDHLYHDFYYRRNDNFWRESALRKLPPLLDSTRMLACAEDLGMIPACVPEVMKQLHMLSLEVQRMPKDPAEAFANTSRYPYLSVCTTSTHDMSGLRGWWEENPDATDRFYHETLGGEGDAPTIADADVCRRAIEQHLDSPSMLCILPLQDWLSIDENLRRPNPHEEQINFPGNSRHYWRYRMHLSVDELRAATNFNATLRQMIADSGR